MFDNNRRINVVEPYIEVWLEWSVCVMVSVVEEGCDVSLYLPVTYE